MSAVEIVEEAAKCNAAQEAALKSPKEAADPVRGVVASLPAVRIYRRRRISREAGRALEMLGHAIEYLADEYAASGQVLSANDAELRAIQILMRVNREIYFACPVVPTIRERWREFVRATTH